MKIPTFRHPPRFAPGLLTLTLAVLWPAAIRSEPVTLLERPAYPLYTICSRPIKATPEDIAAIAKNFTLMHGKFTREQMEAVRKLNPDFIFLTYINSTYSRAAEEVGPAETGSRRGLAMHLSARSAQRIGPLDTRFKVQPVRESEEKGADGKPGIAIRASTVAGAVSSTDAARPSTQHYVFWIRAGDELMRVEQFDAARGELEVTRGFAGTAPATHEAGSPVFSPIYLGFLRHTLTVDDVEQGAGKHPGNYPGGPGGHLRYVFDPAQPDGNRSKAELTLECITELGVDGVWMDTFNTGDFNLSDCRGRQVVPWNFRKGEPYDKDEFREGQERKVTAIQNFVKEKTGRYPYLVANNLKTATYYRGTGGMKLLLMPTPLKPRPLEGFCMEGALALHDEPTWRARMQTLMDSAQTGLAAMPILGGAGAKSMLAEVDTPERDQRERFGYASYLLTVESGGRTRMGTYAFYSREGQRTVKVHPIYFYPIGKPAESRKPGDIDGYRLGGGQVFGRRFTNGLVLVNAAERATAVSLESGYLDPDTGTRVSRLEMPAGTGKILLIKPGL